MIYLYSKRFTDIVISLFSLCVLFPFLLVIALIIKLNSNGPVFYRGKRSARHNGTFLIYKFRTMVNDAEKKGGFSTAIDDHRFTSVGRILRRFKIDELPQFINVLFGEMSLIGPRPQVEYYTNLYTEDESVILSVRPGITDLASIYFVDMDDTLGSINVDEKYQLEIEPVKNKLRIQYVKEMSFMLDMKILIGTLFRIIGFKNITNLNFHTQ